MKYADLKSLIGLTMVRVERLGDDEICFECNDGRVFKLRHEQHCCESVEIEDVVGDLSDLVGSPILKAEEATSEGVNPPGVPVPDNRDSFTWTFYKFATVKGYVDIRWYGSSNGYYSESVDFMELE